MPKKLSPRGQSAQRVHRVSEGHGGEERRTENTNLIQLICLK